MSEMVILSAQEFLAEGTDRKCYRHPTRSDCCIKVLHPHRRSDRFWREIRYFSSLRRRRVDFRHIAEYRGWVETSFGVGALFELVRDDDQRVSRSLEHYLQLNDPDFNRRIAAEIENLKQDLFDQWIVVHDLNPTNILVQRLGFDSFRLVLIDGVGHNHVIPLASYSRVFARKKLTRKWNRRIPQWYSPYPDVLKQLEPYPTI